MDACDIISYKSEKGGVLTYMQYAIIGICILVVVVLGLIVFRESKSRKNAVSILPATDTKDIFVPEGQEKQEFFISAEMLPAEAISEDKRLVEITDSKVLAHISSLVPGLAQAGNAANNVMQAVQGTGEVLYRAIIPAGAKLADSKSMEGAVRAIYHGANGIAGQANLVAVEASKSTAVIANTAAAAMGVASMVVGQYYMTQINAELGAISDGISKISDFQDNEYRSRVFSLIAHVKRIADFQVEILENNELRLSKISQLDSLEEECTQLLGQANLTLADCASRTSLDYKEYEKALRDAQNWFMYQNSLLDVLYKISELRYTLYLGAVSREQCVALLPAYTKQVDDTQKKLTSWHQNMTKQLNIDTAKVRRKRKGLDGIVHSIPGYFNDDSNFRAIEASTAKMIDEQARKHHDSHQQDTTDLYAQDVHIIAKGGKIYYLPEPEN